MAMMTKDIQTALLGMVSNAFPLAIFSLLRCVPFSTRSRSLDVPNCLQLRADPFGEADRPSAACGHLGMYAQHPRCQYWCRSPGRFQRQTAGQAALKAIVLSGEQGCPGHHREQGHRRYAVTAT